MSAKNRSPIDRPLSRGSAVRHLRYLDDSTVDEYSYAVLYCLPTTLA